MPFSSSSSRCCVWSISSSEADSSSSSSLEVRKSCHSGRGLWSSSPIRGGEEVLSNEPICHVLNRNYVETRCSFCFTSPADGSPGLLKCSKCKFVQYCNLFCQKSDWKQHKAECKALVFSESNFSLLKVCGAFSGEEALLDDARILLRLSGVLLNDSTNCETVTRMDCADSIVRCGVSHVMDMSSVPQENSNHTHDDYPLAVKIVSNILSKGGKREPALSSSELFSLLKKCHANNFGILDDLLQCIGAGMYPAVALLNHSCQPSCILRYEISSRHAVVLRVIGAGHQQESALHQAVSVNQRIGVDSIVELTHSYVDLAQPTPQRQEKLKKTYGFSCVCSRCSSNCQLFVNEPFSKSGSFEELLKVSIVNHSKEPNVALDLEEAITQTLGHVSVADMDQAFHWKNKAMIQSGVEMEEAVQEIICLEKALSIYNKNFGPLNFELYKLHGQLLTASLVAGDYDRALQYCFRVVGYLLVALAEVPFHPLVGLQLYTLGDILGLKNRGEEARYVHSLSYEILKRAYGNENEMVQRLGDSLF